MPPAQNPGTAPAASSREVRVDFFRGIAMFIILVAHMPGNKWSSFIPARFGPSDGAEMFVFCSGFASAMAFGSVFANRGFGIGIARVAFRVWQIYWAHICLFLAVALVCVAGTYGLETKDYVGRLNLYKFFDNPQAGLLHLLTLTYVPNFFDILPMYIVVLMLVPLMVALNRLHVAAFIAGAFALWFAAPSLALPAEWWSQRSWFFNPFAWQLVFFTGFAFGARWVKPPKPNWGLISLCLVFVIVLIPVSRWQIYNNVDIPYQPLLKEIRGLLTGDNIQFGVRKTNFGIIRWLHFLALAYLMYCFFASREHWLRMAWAKPIITVGQQSLAVFLFSMVAAWALSMILDVHGRTWAMTALVNLFGFFLLWLVARIAGYFKSSPWRARRPAPAAGAAPVAGKEPSSSPPARVAPAA